MTSTGGRDDLNELDLHLAVVERETDTLVRALDRIPIGGRANVRDLVRDLALSRILYSARGFGGRLHGVLRRDPRVTCAYARVLVRYLVAARGIADPPASVRVRDVIIALVFGPALAFDLAFNRRRDLCDSRACADAIAVTVARARSRLARAQAPNLNPEVCPIPSALWLLQQMLELLPLGARTRYSEELEAELTELAVAGVSGRGQLTYTLRLAARMWSLRRALRFSAPGQERGPVR